MLDDKQVEIPRHTYGRPLEGEPFNEGVEHSLKRRRTIEHSYLKSKINVVFIRFLLLMETFAFRAVKNTLELDRWIRSLPAIHLIIVFGSIVIIGNVIDHTAQKLTPAKSGSSTELVRLRAARLD